MMEYKGYQADVQFDADDEVFHGRVINLRDGITFEATDVATLKTEFRAAVDGYLAFCAERNEEPDRPFSGRFVVRMEPEVHRKVARASAMEHMSLNGWVIRHLDICAAKIIDASPGPAAVASQTPIWRHSISRRLDRSSQVLVASRQGVALSTRTTKRQGGFGTAVKQLGMTLPEGEQHDT